jgi:hypothetical protein
MPDLNIDQIIAGGAGASTRADFSGLANLPDAYRKAADFAYQQKMRNVFNDENGGLPRDSDGNVDSSKLYERLMQAGGAPAVEAAAKAVESGLTQDRIRFAPTAATILGNPDQPSAAAPGNFPPSVNRSGSAVVAAPLARGGVVPSQAQPQGAPVAQGGDKPGSLMGFLANWGVPDELAGSEMNILGGKLSAALGRRIDPNQPLDMNDPKIRVVLGDWVRSRGGRSAAPSAPPAPDADVAPSFSARFAGGPSGQMQQPVAGATASPQPQPPAQSNAGPAQPAPAGPQPSQQNAARCFAAAAVCPSNSASRSGSGTARRSRCG